MHPTVARVVSVLDAAGWSGEVRELSESARTAAAALGCDVGAIASSLLFQTAGSPLLVLTSGAHRVDTCALAELLGLEAVDKAPASLVRDATGYAIGTRARVGP